MPKSIKGLTTLKSGLIRARYTHRGTTYSRYFRTRGKAQSWLDDERKLIALDAWTPPAERETKKKLAATTVGQYFETLPAKRHWQSTTARGYKSMFDNDIRPVLGDKALQAVTRDDIREWYFGMLKGHKGRDKRNRDVYCLLQTIFSHAVKEELIEVSPVNIPGASKRPPAQREQEIPTPEEFAKLVAAVPARYRVPVMVAAGCALRIGEWAELRRKDMHHDGHTGVWKLHIRRQVREGGSSKEVVPFTKSKRDRWVTVPASIVPALQQHLATYSQPGRDGLLFPNQDGVWVDRRRFNRLLKRSSMAAFGRDDMHSHLLRHYGGTEFARAGATLAETMARLGHSTVSAALKYQHAAESRDAEIANRIDIRMPLVAVEDTA